MLYSGFLNDPGFADEKKATEAPWKDEPEIKRLDGYGAVQSDLERGYLEPLVTKWIPRDESNYRPKILDDLDCEGNQEPIFPRTVF